MIRGVPIRAGLAIAAAAVSVACATAPGSVRTELEAYLQRAESWAPVEAETARTLERILRTQFVDEAEVRRQIADSRLRVRAHLDSIRAYSPRASPIARIHSRYVVAWERLLAGYDAIEEGFSSGDYTRLARGRQAMAAWRDDLIAVAAELREMRQRASPPAEGAAETWRPPRAPQSSMHRT